MDDSLLRRMQQDAEHRLAIYEPAPIPRDMSSQAPKNGSELGRGTYGSVSFVRNKWSGVPLALKEFTEFVREGEGISLALVREFSFLQEFSRGHPNIISAEEYIMMPQTKKAYLVMEFADTDLLKLLVQPKYSKLRLNEGCVKNIMRQVLSGVNHLHENGVMHRDLKPANILIRSRDQDCKVESIFQALCNDPACVKLSDFGLSRVCHSLLRRIDSDGPVVSLYWRAPEVLMGSAHYTRAIDVWSIGCIFSELFRRGNPLFKGNMQSEKTRTLEIDQIRCIFKVFGMPSEIAWPDVKSLLYFEEVKKRLAEETFFEASAKQNLPSKYFNPGDVDVPTGTRAFISKFLQYDPSKRITIEEALRDPYLQ